MSLLRYFSPHGGSRRQVPQSWAALVRGGPAPAPALHRADISCDPSNLCQHKWGTVRLPLSGANLMVCANV
jgi:hypothetical protein